MFSLYSKLLKSYTQDPRTAPTESRERYEFDAGASRRSPSTSWAASLRP